MFLIEVELSLFISAILSAKVFIWLPVSPAATPKSLTLAIIDVITSAKVCPSVRVSPIASLNLSMPSTLLKVSSVSFPALASSSSFLVTSENSAEL